MLPRVDTTETALTADALARQIADGIRDIDGAIELDTDPLARFVVREVRRAVSYPLEITAEDDVATRWAEALGGFYATDTLRELLGNVTRQAVSKRRDLLALRTGRGRLVYPKRQFRRGRPAVGMAAVLDAVPEAAVDRWSLAGWLAEPHEQLDGDRPFDALHDGRAGLVIDLAGDLARRAAA